MSNLSDSIQEYITPEFIEHVKKYIECDDKIKELKTEIKKIAVDKNIAEERILDKLSTMNEISIDINNGKIRKHVAKSKGSIKKEYITETLKSYMAGPDLDNVTEKILDKVPIKEKVSLQRVKA